MTTHDRTASGARRTPAHPLACLALLAGFAVALSGCGGDGGNYSELLIVGDGLTVASFSVSNGVATELGTAMIPGIPGTYSRTGSLVTVTMQKHNIPTGYRVFLDFSAGTGGTATDGTYVVTDVDDDTFTVVDTASGSITAGTVLRSPGVQLAATYSQTGTTVTITLPNHGLDDTDTVILDYTSGAAIDDDVEIDTVPDANTFTVIADAPANTSGSVNVIVGGNYTIFGIAMHPNGRWIYVTSQYDCYNGSPYCWAGDMISRLAINWGNGHLTFEESYRTSDDPSATSSSPSPVTLVFSEDGTRLFHQDDDLDGLRMWDVDPADGSIVLSAASAPGTTGQHGIAVLPDGSRVYHGTRVFTVAPAALTLTTPGDRGESNQILGTTMFAIMGGGGTAQIRTYSLADPDAPAEIASSADVPNIARDMALFDNGALIVTSGFGGLKSYTYDGSSIVPAVGAGDTELRDDGAPWPGDDVLARVYRTVSRNAAGTLVASAYFTHDPLAGTGGVPPSGFILASVAPDGSLTLLEDYQGAYYARVARFFQKP